MCARCARALSDGPSSNPGFLSLDLLRLWALRQQRSTSHFMAILCHTERSTNLVGSLHHSMPRALRIRAFRAGPGLYAAHEMQTLFCDNPCFLSVGALPAKPAPEALTFKAAHCWSQKRCETLCKAFYIHCSVFMAPVQVPNLQGLPVR